MHFSTAFVLGVGRIKISKKRPHPEGAHCAVVKNQQESTVLSVLGKRLIHKTNVSLVFKTFKHCTVVE